MSAKLVTVYYDGQCPLCAREIAHHRSLTAGEPVSYVDIAAGEFDSAAHGVDPARVQEVLHVRVGDEMRTGVEAVIAMWDAVPRYRWLARVTRLPGVHAVAYVMYHAFARIRPYLQRRQRRSCETGGCR